MNRDKSVNFLSLLTFCSHFLTGCYGSTSLSVIGVLECWSPQSRKMCEKTFPHDVSLEGRCLFVFEHTQYILTDRKILKMSALSWVRLDGSTDFFLFLNRHFCLESTK